MKKYTSVIVIVGITIAIVGGIVWYSSTPGQFDGLAQCLKDRGVTFYGAFWCPHCQEQKAEFGKSAKLLPYFECSTPDGSSQLPACREEGIEGYPTWVFADGSRKSEVLTPSALAEITNCSIQ
ncbi:MAG: hypothetical protein COV01_01760 [Candidatus Taylorbacteria bacterium CG10_big_fil_rev_8_21_14_0_10_41_48]|uniref:Thioredoxin domain-containing protein n=1 Tax=Candidatus Taylorbacteria bacterium CG10_big_fil_rev_8_21_14_0_10_41_48 TaxID=1975024 RepID=A0A2M8LCB1_9BACT|nr:MAG: hypothetical protein COV01_01760 [Candidatus Taylorbacteria bacterium CG10_big_fil_rev_8_21_14_0_10_41_48]